jgi:hypothetical protein
MWRFRKNNLIINDQDKLFAHKVHLEKLLKAKPHIQNKGPEMPNFLKNKLSINEYLRSKEHKRCYENAVIFSRLLDIDNSISEYSYINRPIYCAAFDKKKYNFDKTEKMRNTLMENKHFFVRLIKQKSHYPTQYLINSKDYELLLKRNNKKRIDNPNINFATFNEFKKNLEKKYKLRRSYSAENIEPIYSNEKRYKKYYQDVNENSTSRNNFDLNYVSSIKSYKDINSKNSCNNIGCLSTMISSKQGKCISRCQSAFMRSQKYYNY